MCIYEKRKKKRVGVYVCYLENKNTIGNVLYVFMQRLNLFYIYCNNTKKYLHNFFSEVDKIKDIN